jgi:predicted dithiol-disulfide oxidoreductase (DUF899 family)
MTAVSRAPIADLQAYKRRMGWSFPWASSLGSDFNYDFNTSYTEERQRQGVIEYNYRSMDVTPVLEAGEEGPVAEFAAMVGTDAATYTREAPGMSAFALEDGVSTTPTPPMPAAWMPSGACTSGSTAHRRDATRPGRGFAAMTSTTRAKRDLLCCASMPRTSHSRSGGAP